MSLDELAHRWSFEDLVQAHEALDVLEDAQVRGQRRAKGETRPLGQ